MTFSAMFVFRDLRTLLRFPKLKAVRGCDVKTNAISPATSERMLLTRDAIRAQCSGSGANCWLSSATFEDINYAHQDAIIFTGQLQFKDIITRTWKHVLDTLILPVASEKNWSNLALRYNLKWMLVNLNNSRTTGTLFCPSPRNSTQSLLPHAKSSCSNFSM